MAIETITNAMRIVESDEFAARLGVASSFHTFLRAAQREDAVVFLQRFAAPNDLLFRLIKVSALRVDKRYENPRDTALAVYLWLLNGKDTRLARASVPVLQQAPNTWWSRKYAKNLLSHDMLSSKVLNRKCLFSI